MINSGTVSRSRRMHSRIQNGFSWLSCLLKGRRRRLGRRGKTSPTTVGVELLEDRTLLSVTTLIIQDAILFEGNDGTTSMQFTVALDAPIGGEFSVDFNTIDGTAVAGEDYIATTGTLIFDADHSVRTVTVPIIGEDLVELDESFSLEIIGHSEFFSVNTVLDELVTINPLTGQITTVGSIGHDMHGTDLAFLDGTIYAVTADDPDAFSLPNWNLLAINPATGQKIYDVPVTLNGAAPIIVDGLVARDGKLLIDFDTADSTSSMLGEIDPVTGEISFVRDYEAIHGFNYDFDGIGVNPAGTLFAVDTALYSGSHKQVAFFELGEAAPFPVTFTGDFVAPSSVTDLTTDGTNLFGLDYQQGDLITLDPIQPPGIFNRVSLVGAGTDLNGLTFGIPVLLAQQNLTATGTIYNDDLAVVSLEQTPYEQQVLADNPLGYWRLGESNGEPTAIDFSGNGLDGNYEGAVTLEQPGALATNPDTSADFDGATGRVILPTLGEIQNLQNDFTVEAWFKADSLTFLQRIFTSARSFTPDGGFSFGIRNGKLSLSAFGEQRYDSVLGDITPGQWYHAVAVFDADNDVSFYLNGAFLDKIEGSAPALVGDGNGWIGSILNGGTQFFNGPIDEVAVYGHALTPETIRNHYVTRESDIPPTLLVLERDSGATTVSFNVTLSNPVDAPVFVTVFPVDGSATAANNDYSSNILVQHLGQTVTFFPGGPLTKTVSVDVTGDETVEFDESFTLRVDHVQAQSRSVTFDEKAAVIQILNDDTAPVAINFTPSPNTPAAHSSSNVSAEFPFGVGGNELVIHAGFSGQLLEQDSIVEISGNTFIWNPDSPFQPGEFVQVTATSDRQDEEIEPVVWQFRTATSPFSSGNFENSGQELGAGNSLEAVLGDLDGDGDLDLFVANRGPNTIWLNDGNGSFTKTDQDLGDDDSWGARLGDLNGDGILDVVVANYGVPDQVLMNDGTGHFTDSGQALEGPSGERLSRDVALADVDGDGDLDAFFATSAGQPNLLFLNEGNGVFTDSGQSLPGGKSFDVSLADLDGDGDLDAFLAQAATSGRANLVLFNDGSGIFSDSGQRLGNEASRGLTLGDIDGDGDVDAVVGDDRSGGTRFWLNDGSGTFSPGSQIIAGTNLDVTLGDLDGDGDLDLFLPNADGSANEIWLNDGHGTFTNSGQSLGNARSTEVALGDLDGDGDLDAVTANFGLAPNTVWFNQDLVAPGQAVLTGPVRYVREDNTPTISWQELPGADSYDLLVSPVGGGTPLVNETGLTGTFFVPAEPLALGRYEVIVRGVNDAGSGPWSDSLPYLISSTALLDFEINVPKMTGPLSEISDRTPVFSWTEPPLAVSYHLILSSNSTGQEVLNVDDIPNPWFTPDMPLPLDDYQVMVKANFSGERTYLFSFPYAFEIQNSLPDLRPIPDQVWELPLDSDDFVDVKLLATDADNDPLTYSVTVEIDPYSQLAYDLDQEYNFTPFSNFAENDYYFNSRGHGERYLQGMYILPNGDLYRWNVSFEQSIRIATLGKHYYENPGLLVDVPAPPAATESLAQLAYELDQEYNFTPFSNFAENDYYFNSRGHGERYLQGMYILPNGDLYRWHVSFEQSIRIATLDSRYHANPGLLVDVPAPSVTPESLSQLVYELDQEYNFTPFSNFAENDYYFNSRGHNERYLQGMYILPNGELYRWHVSFEQSIRIAKLDSRYHENPGLLVDVPAPSVTPESLSQLAYELDQEYNFTPFSNFAENDYYFNSRGHNERYLQGMYILPNGDLYRWHVSFEQSIRIATLDSRYHADPSLLVNVSAPPLRSLFQPLVSLRGSVLTVEFQENLPGIFLVNVTAHDVWDRDIESFAIVVRPQRPDLENHYSGGVNYYTGGSVLTSVGAGITYVGAGITFGDLGTNVTLLDEESEYWDEVYADLELLGEIV